MSYNKNLVIRDDLQIRIVGEETLIYDSIEKKIHLVNETANDVIGLLKDGKSQDEIIDCFTYKYNLDRDEVERDILNILDEFESLKFFKLSD